MSLVVIGTAPGHPPGGAARRPAARKVRKSSRIGAARHMIAAEGLAAAGQMITRYRDGGQFTSDYQVARLTVALRDLRVRDDAWARMDPEHADAHLRLWTDVTRRAQPGHVAAPAACLPWQPGSPVMAQCKLGDPAAAGGEGAARGSSPGVRRACVRRRRAKLM
jgi:Domain of unknown function (DUF4192)